MSHKNFKQPFMIWQIWKQQKATQLYSVCNVQRHSRDSSSSNPTCTFCKQNHSSAKCNIITDPTSRKAILRSKAKQSKAKCLICLRSGHKASECKSTNWCFKCNSKRHLSICEVYGWKSRNGITQGPDNRIGNSSQNGNNKNSTLNMTDSDNAESVDNTENSHTMLSINKGTMFYYKPHEES